MKGPESGGGGEEVVEAGAGGMGGHGGLDFEGKGEGFPSLPSGDVGLAAGADGLDERLDFQAERFAGGDG